jgi:serine/threonine protein kinase
MLHGKHYYLSPEQILGGPVDRRSDIFSLGVVLYEMLTAVRPFDGEDEVETMRLITTCEVKPPTQFLPSISSDLEAIIMKALAKNPDDRFSEAAEMAEQIFVILKKQKDAAGHRQMSLFLNNLFPEQPDMDSKVIKGFPAKTRENDGNLSSVVCSVEIAAGKDESSNRRYTFSPSEAVEEESEQAELRSNQGSSNDLAVQEGRNIDPMSSLISSLCEIEEVQSAIVGDVAGGLTDFSPTKKDPATVAAAMGLMICSINQAGELLGLGSSKQVTIASQSELCVVSVKQDSVVTVFTKPVSPITQLEKKLQAVLDQS